MTNLIQRTVEAIGLTTQEQLQAELHRVASEAQHTIEIITQSSQEQLRSELATVQSEAAKQANRAYEAGYFDGSNGNDEPVSGTLASYGYSRASTGKRDFTNMSHDQLLNIAWILYQSNPLAKRYLEIVRDHILGRGVKYTTEDIDLRDIFDVFWKRNKMSANLKDFVPQKRSFGEQCYPAFVRKTDGRVTLGYIDPADIEHVCTHPHNALKRVAVILKYDATSSKRKIYRIITEDEGYVRGNRVIPPQFEGKLVTHNQVEIEPYEQLMLEANGLTEYTGSCFYYSVNNASNQPRGVSDFLQVADWLDAHDETLFAIADREQMAGYFSWDVTLDNTNEPDLKQKASEIARRVPKKGQVLVHNDKEHWEMKSPDLKQQASIATSDALSDLAWGMLGMPKTWRGIGEGTNYASGLTMGEPTRKSLESKQDDTKDMIVEILTFVRDQAEIAGYYTPQTKRTITTPDGTERTEDIEHPGEFDVAMPEMSATDMGQVATALPQIVNALSVLVNDLRVVSRDRAAEVTAKILAEIGVKYDAHEELEAVDNATEDDESDELAIADDTNKQLLGLMSNGKPASADTAPSNLDSVLGLNGTQITAALDVLAGMTGGSISAIAATELLVALGIDRQRVAKIVSSTNVLSPVKPEPEPAFNGNGKDGLT